MPDRSDVAALILFVVGFVSLVILRLLFAGSGELKKLVGDYGPFILFLIVTVPMFSYAIYWAFDIRRALVVRLYRRQALGIGIVVLAIWATLGIFVGLPSSISLQLSTAVSNLAFYLLFFVLFYWIDASILASRRSDPLLRDPLYWSKVRIPIWGANILTWGTILLLIAYSEFTNDVSLLNELNNGTFSNPILAVAYNFPFVVLLCGVIYLPAIAIRSGKWDRALRRHFIWFAPSSALLMFFFFIAGSLPVTPVGLVAFYFLILLIGFTLYRSAKALVPLNRLSPEEVAK
jgi:hypothetical protein